MEDKMSQFLETQAADGVYESSREFSVNLIAAQQKLGRYSLPRRTAWILKFVQAATEAGCERLDLKITKDRVEVEFPDGSFSPVKGLRERLETLRPQNLAEDHLFGGLLASHALGGELYMESAGLRWYPAETRDFENLPEVVNTPRLIFLPKRLSFWEKIRARLWFTAALMEELQQNCFPCPVNLHLDSRELTFGYQDVPLASGLIQGQEGAELDFYGQLQRETGKKDVTFSLWGSNRPPHIGYAVQIRVSGKKEPSTLSMEWIRSGVVVKREVLETASSKRLIARILISTRGLQFDASGFAIKDCEESRERQAIGATYLGQAVQAIKGELSREKRWERFLDKNYQEVQVPTAEELANQLDTFNDWAKVYFHP